MRPQSVQGNRSNYGGGSLFTSDESATLISELGIPRTLNQPNVRAQTSHRILDKSSILWREFLTKVKRRKRTLNKLREIALNDTTTSGMLKRMLLEVRQMTISVIEDALEIEYRSQFNKKSKMPPLKSGATMQLPPISSYRGMDENEDVYALSDMITDMDDVCKMPIISVFLPMEFPRTRNPFLLGKTVDELSNLVPPQPEQGNLEEELKVLELLRYKRASKALLRAESQVLNKLPIELPDIERLFLRMSDDFNIEKLIRAVCTFLDNDKPNHGQAPELHHLSNLILIEPYDFLMKINQFRGDQPMRIDVQAAVRQSIRDCRFEYLNDNASVFLIEWINSILSRKPPTNALDEWGMKSSSVHDYSSKAIFQINTNVKKGSLLDDNSTVESQNRKIHQETSAIKALVSNNRINIPPSASGPILHGPGRESDLVSIISGDNAKDWRGQNDTKIRQFNTENTMLNHPSDDHSIGSVENLNNNGQRNESTVVSDNNSDGPIVSIEDGGGQIKKKRKKKDPSVNIKMIRDEVKKAIHEQALSRRMKLGGDDDSEQNMGLATEEETLSSVRYELVKLQQELLRRRVLDPRHYKAVSVDTTTAIAQGLTEIDTEQRKKAIAPKVIPIAERGFGMKDGQGVIEFVWNTDVDNITGNIYKWYDINADGDVITPQLRAVGSIAVRREKELMAFANISKLIFNRVTGNTFESVMEITSQPQRVTMMEMLFDQLQSKALENPPPLGSLTIRADRVIYKKPLNGDGVVVDLAVSRNVRCDGLIIIATPSQSGLLASGPVTITLMDRELQILLINQRSLYLLAQSKWSCMQMIAQWLSSRINVRRIKVIDTMDINFDDTKAPSLLDVALDRKVELAREAVQQWVSRNVPTITGMTVDVSSVQELEMLRIEIRLIIPHPKVRQNMKLGDNDEQLLTNFDDFDDDSRHDDLSAASAETKESISINSKNFAPVVIPLSYRLTVAELNVFGSSEIKGERKISLAGASGDNHPSAFMWNVLSRLWIDFKGLISDPYSRVCNADVASNWSIRYDRRLFRDIRNISGGVLIITATVVGNEILYEAEPTEGSIYKTVGSKLMEHNEIADLVHSEGWPPSLLEPNQRGHLAYRILEKLKVVQEKGNYFLQPYNYAESKILTLILQVPNKADINIGCIEINSYHTLTDLRTLIKHEIDRELIPRQYRFLYKNNPCSVRQESFRRAWECLPKIFIVSKIVRLSDDPAERKKELEEREKKKQEEDKVAMKLEAGQRRVGKKLVPVPIPTLAYVQEGSNEIYLMHDSRDLIIAGDVIRIGHPQSRDYIVSLRSRVLQNAYPKQVRVDPAYDLLGEPEYDEPICGNMPYPKAVAGIFKGTVILDTPLSLGYTFDLPSEPDETKNNQVEANGVNATTANDLSVSTTIQSNVDMKKLAQSINSSANSVDSKNEVKLAIQRLEDSQNCIWREVWLYKCIPPTEDNRPKWRRLYDDGLIKYDYIYSKSKDGIKIHKVFAPYSYLEVLCTDSRVPSMSMYPQRVQAMQELTVDYYTKTAFNSMMSWFPQSDRGVESSKFIRLMRDCKIFPDIKKPGRVGQLDIMFQKEVRGENGILDKYVNFVGFTRILQEVALSRYPPAADTGSQSGSLAGDVSVIGDEGSLGGSISSIGSSKGSKASNIIRSAKGGAMIQKKATNKSVYGNSKKSKKKGTDKSEDNSENDVNEQVIIDPEYAANAYRKLITEYIMNHKDWENLFWIEAKISCMNKVAVTYCAATRIQAFVRQHIMHYKYTFFRQQLIFLQALVRRKITMVRVAKFTVLLVEDWIFRLRYHKATKIASIIRRYLTRCWVSRIMQKLKEQQVVVQKARRLRFKRLRSQQKKGIIYKETKRINGIMCLLTLWRKDTRAYSKDFGIVIQIYIPKSQMTYKFPVEEKDLTNYMLKELPGVEALSPNDLMDKKNLEKVVSSRLIIRESIRPGQPPQVLFSRQALGQRGGHVMTHGKIISGDSFVCSVFETGADIEVQSYHRKTCNVFRSSITIPDLHKWVWDEQHARKDLDELQKQNTPKVLLPSKKLGLYKWAIDRLVIDTKKSTFKVLFSCQQKKSIKLKMITKLQAFARRIITRPKIISLVDSFMLKVRVNVKDPKKVYYVNRKTGQSQWERPSLLKSQDLPTKIMNKWYSLMYNHEGTLYEHYVNPYNGRYTHLSYDKAARTIQSLVRNHLLKLILITRDVLQKVVPLVKNAENVYEKNKDQLRAVINYALVAHIVHKNEPLGKELYIRSLDLSEASPLVTRSFAFYILCTCEPPLLLAREKALRWLADAKRRDENHDKFKMAYNVYRYALLHRPKDPQTLINLSLVEILVYNNKSKAEKMLRRAIAIAPFDPRVVEIWNYLKDQFPERQLLYNAASAIEQVDTSKGGKKRVIHGRPCAENPSWAGWCYVTEDPYKMTKILGPYWYNPVTGREKILKPDFQKEWNKRKLRSKFEGEKHGLEIYFDPLTSCHFQYHVMSDTYM